MRRLALVIATFALFAALPATANAQGCITKLPVTHSFKNKYSVYYEGRRATNLKITSYGSWIRNVKAEIYTFEGELIAKSKLYRSGFNTSRRLRLKLRYRSLQAGKYTLIVTGEPNASSSCGPKKYTQIVEFYNCPKELPIEFPDLPGGKAGDYGRWLSVNLQPKGGALRNVLVELFDIDGNFFGRKRLKVLYGTAKVDIPLKHKLLNGRYSLIVHADGGLPRRCGEKTAKRVLRFGTSGGGGGVGDDGTDPAAGEDEAYDLDSFDDGGTDGGDGTPAR